MSNIYQTINIYTVFIRGEISSLKKQKSKKKKPNTIERLNQCTIEMVTIWKQGLGLYDSRDVCIMTFHQIVRLTIGFLVLTDLKEKTTQRMHWCHRRLFRRLFRGLYRWLLRGLLSWLFRRFSEDFSEDCSDDCSEDYSENHSEVCSEDCSEDRSEDCIEYYSVSSAVYPSLGPQSTQ